MGISYKNFGPSAKMSGMKVLPPAAIAKHYSTGDPLFNDVVFLATFDGNVTDVISGLDANVTQSGIPTYGTDAFGGQSFAMNNHWGPYYPADTTYGPTGDFTLEAWIKPVSANGDGVVLTTTNSGSTNPDGWWLYQRSGGTLEFRSGTNYSDVVEGTHTLADNTWSHVAVQRTGNLFELFCDGALIASATDSRTINSGGEFAIGHFRDSALYEFVGEIGSVRLTNVARYSAPFNVPTEEFPTS